MHYSYEVTVTPSDDYNNPVVYEIKLASGILLSADFLFEVGDGFSTCVCLWSDSKQLLPVNVEGFYTGDNIMIHAPCYYPLTAEGNLLYLVAWNRGGIYDHDVNVYLHVKGDNEPDVYSLQQSLNDTIDRLISLIRSMF